jgi:uncharacterized membrane-anchored protein YitT (DUF2179 family)
MKNIIKKILLMTLGCLCYAVGVAFFFEPNNLASGGVSGLSIIIAELIDFFPIGTWVIIFNIPILIAGVWKLGIKILLPTMYCVALSSVAMNFFQTLELQLTENTLLACCGGAVIIATGIGLVFRGGATTGGTDIIVKLLRLKFPHVSTGAIFLIADGTICLISGFVFQDIDKALFAGIAVFIQMMVLNTVLYGSDEARLVYIISEKKSEIANRLLEELDVGATFLNGVGAYAGKEKHVLMCVMRMRLLPQAREVVRATDENAFMIVTKATSVFGEGFKSHSEEDL